MEEDWLFKGMENHTRMKARAESVKVQGNYKYQLVISVNAKNDLHLITNRERKKWVVFLVVSFSRIAIKNFFSVLITSLTWGPDAVELRQ